MPDLLDGRVGNLQRTSLWLLVCRWHRLLDWQSTGNSTLVGSRRLKHPDTVQFEPSKFKVLFQGWQEFVPALTLRIDQLEVTDNFNYIGNWVTTGGRIGEEITWGITKITTAFENKRQSRHHHAISFKEGRPLWLRHLEVPHWGCSLAVFEYRCFRSNGWAWWENRARNDEVRCCDRRFLTEMFAQHRFDGLDAFCVCLLIV